MVVHSQLRTGSSSRSATTRSSSRKSSVRRPGRAHRSPLQGQEHRHGADFPCRLRLGEKFVRSISTSSREALLHRRRDLRLHGQEPSSSTSFTKDDLGDNAGYISPDDDYPIEITFYDGKPSADSSHPGRAHNYLLASGVKATLRQDLQAATSTTGIRGHGSALLRYRHEDQARHPRGTFAERVK